MERAMQNVDPTAPPAGTLQTDWVNLPPNDPLIQNSVDLLIASTSTSGINSNLVYDTVNTHITLSRVTVWLSTDHTMTIHFNDLDGPTSHSQPGGGRRYPKLCVCAG